VTGSQARGFLPLFSTLSTVLLLITTPFLAANMYVIFLADQPDMAWRLNVLRMAGVVTLGRPERGKSAVLPVRRACIFAEGTLM
jgi:hypothetical protein